MNETKRNYSHSYIQAFKKCPLACQLKYEVGLKKLDNEASEHHLVYGAAMHRGLKHIYLGDTLENSIDQFKLGYPRQLDETDTSKTIANGVLALNGYVKHWALEDKKWKVITCEVKDTFEYLDDPFTVVLDLVVENREFGGIYGVDHKIVGGKRAYLSADFWGDFNPNSQVTKYYSFITSKYGDCSGFYINAIGMGYRSRAYKGEPAGPWQRYGRMMFNRDAAQMDIERKDTETWIERIDLAKSNGRWGMNTDSCKYCEFKEICQAGWAWPDDADNITIQYGVNK